MKPGPMQQHLLLDGYDTQAQVAEDVDVMEALLHEINAIMFRHSGSIQIIPVFSNEKPRNNGVSGVILAPGGHFTCHTFSQRGVLFADAYPVSRRERYRVREQIVTAFRPHHVQCRQGDCGTGFGRHVVLRLPHRPAEFWQPLIQNIVSTIGMHELGIIQADAHEHGFDLIRPITESHIAVHVNDVATVLDVFSCKDFSTDILLQTLIASELYPTAMLTVTRGVQMVDKIL